jgi:hypothetical protein
LASLVADPGCVQKFARGEALAVGVNGEADEGMDGRIAARGGHGGDRKHA